MTPSELSAARCRRRGESAQVPPCLLRPVGGTCAAAAACAPDCSGRWSAGQGRGTAAGCACAEARRAQHLPAGWGGAAGSPRGPSQIHAPRLHAARGAEPDRRVFRAAKQARIRSRNVSTPSALAVASELGVAAGTHLSEDMRPPAPVGRWAAARAGGQPRLTLKIAEQSLRRLGAAAGELHEVYRAGLSQVPARADVCGTHHTNFHRVGATTAAASPAVRGRLIVQPDRSLDSIRGSIESIVDSGTALAAMCPSLARRRGPWSPLPREACR